MVTAFFIALSALLACLLWHEREHHLVHRIASKEALEELDQPHKPDKDISRTAVTQRVVREMTLRGRSLLPVHKRALRRLFK